VVRHRVVGVAEPVSPPIAYRRPGFHGQRDRLGNPGRDFAPSASHGQPEQRRRRCRHDTHGRATESGNAAAVSWVKADIPICRAAGLARARSSPR
jgi:hypothetical protein